MIERSTIERAAEMLFRAAPPGSRIILFGSHARGDARADSDVDFLVIEPEVKDRRGEMVRLSDVVRPLRIPVDVLVTSARMFAEWSDTPNNVLYDAAKEGVVLNEVP